MPTKLRFGTTEASYHTLYLLATKADLQAALQGGQAEWLKVWAEKRV